MKKAVLIFSGGQDSTTCLGWALKKFKYVECITFNYGQNHSIEIKQSKKICKKYNVKQTIIDISFLNTIVESALTSNGNVNKINKKGLPDSFVPNRNQLFITLAHAYAQKINCKNLITGVCETDFSGYPDCRQEFITSIQKTSNLGSAENISIWTPLMLLSKKDIWEYSRKFAIIDDVIELSHTCYNGNRKNKNEWGYGCDNCPACELRKKGYYEFIKKNK
jgi:7-cyano-7-deazaguanine synthase